MPAALGREYQTLKRRLNAMPAACADGIQHRQQGGRFGAPAPARFGNHAGRVFRQARRPISHEQAFAEPRHRLDVVLARAGGEMPDGVAVRAGGVTLLGPLDVRG